MCAKIVKMGLNLFKLFKQDCRLFFPNTVYFTAVVNKRIHVYDIANVSVTKQQNKADFHRCFLGCQ